MSVLSWVRRRIHDIATLRPILKILGVKSGTVADKATEVAQTVDQELPPPQKP